jgi:hypothetical protein
LTHSSTFGFERATRSKFLDADQQNNIPPTFNLTD